MKTGPQHSEFREQLNSGILSPNPSHLRERGAAPRHPEERSDEGLLFRTTERGTIEVKGKGSMTTYWLEGAQ